MEINTSCFAPRYGYLSTLGYAVYNEHGENGALVSKTFLQSGAI